MVWPLGQGFGAINPIAAAIGHRVESGQDRSGYETEAAAKPVHPSEPVVCGRT